MKLLTFGIVFLMLALTPLSAFAGPRGGGGRPRGGGGARSAPASRPAPTRPAPASRPPSGGFNLNNDVSASRPQGNVNRNASNNNVNRNNTNVNRNVNNTNANRNVNNANVNRNGNVNVGNTVNVNRVVVANPVYRGPAWGWNHGTAWYPAPTYWGGGFWGALAIGATSAAIYGSIVSANQTYTSYQVQASSPGYTLLSNYHLQQTQCGPPNLVVVYGPNNSVICAVPNDVVAAGNYNLDTSTLSLTSQ